MHVIRLFSEPLAWWIDGILGLRRELGLRCGVRTSQRRLGALEGTNIPLNVDVTPQMNTNFINKFFHPLFYHELTLWWPTSMSTARYVPVLLEACVKLVPTTPGT